MVFDEKSTVLLRSLCICWATFLFLLSRFFVLVFWHTESDVPIFDVSTFIPRGVCWAAGMYKLMFSSNLGSFQPLFLYILFLPLFFSPSFWRSHYVCIGIVDGVPPISDTVFIFFHSFFFLFHRLDNLSSFKLTDFFFNKFISTEKSLIEFFILVIIFVSLEFLVGF